MPTIKPIVHDKSTAGTLRGFSLNPHPSIQPARPKAEPAKPEKKEAPK